MLNSLQSFLNLARINVRERQRVFAMAKVMLEKQYSGSLLGIGWAVVKPSLFIFVYWFAIAVGVRGSQQHDGIPFILWLIPGIIPWFFLSEAFTTGGMSIRHNSHLVTKLVYPVPTIPVSEVLSLLFVHLIMVAIVTAIFLLTGFGLSIYYLQIFYYLACTLWFALAAAVALSALTAISKDVGHMVRSTIQVGFWLSPILWSADKLDGPLRVIIKMNPIAYIVQGYRNCFVNERWFFEQWEYGLYFWAVMLVLTLIGSVLFERLQKEFADVL